NFSLTGDPGTIVVEALTIESIIDARLSAGLGGGWEGVYPAIVWDINKSESLDRVKVTLPWAPDNGGSRYDSWARIATLMAGNNRGTWFIPDVGDEVLVAFELGDPRRPYVLGGLWNGQDAPPESMDSSGRNAKKVLRSRNGVKMTLDDTDGQETLVLETPGGQKITLKDGPGSIEVRDSNGNSIKLESAGFTATPASKLAISASTIEVTAGMVTVNAGMSKFS